MEKSIDLNQIKEQVQDALHFLIKQSGLIEGDIFVLGMSSSEVMGSRIGKNSNALVGEVIVKSVKDILDDLGIYLAVQACEHINRSLVVERKLAYREHSEIVNVRPVLKAGGAGATAAYKFAKDPVVVERIRANAGMDIGDTNIGMHVRFVQVPVRFDFNQIGEAHLTALRSRPKNIGGERAQYS